MSRNEAIARLRAMLKPGDKVTTTVLHVSRSGMSRSIQCQAIEKDASGAPYIADISWLVARATGNRLDDRGGVIVTGCGMNMCFSLVYDLGRTLFPDGFGVVGTNSQGRHVRPKSKRGAARMVTNGVKFRGRNGDASGWDEDGGYALGYR